MIKNEDVQNARMEELYQKLDDLWHRSKVLESENKALYEENKLLIDYISKIGIKIKTDLCTSYDYRDSRCSHFKRVDLERASFYVEAPQIERTEEFLSMLRNGEALPPFRFNSYCRNLTHDFSSFSDMDMIEYKYQREVGVK